MKTTEEIILGTAKELFLENGYKNTNMSDIAAKAGINRTTLHYYYNTKEKMFQAVFSQILEYFIPAIKTILNTETDLFVIIDKLIDEYFKLLLANPSLPSFILGEINRDRDQLISSVITLGIPDYMDIIEEILAEEQSKGNIKKIPTEIIAMSLISQVIFPFLTKNIFEEIGFGSLDSPSQLLEKWKQTISTQLRNLLNPSLLDVYVLSC